MAEASLDEPNSGSLPRTYPDQKPTLSICLRCRDDREQANDEIRGGARLAQAVLQILPHSSALNIRGVHCLSQCKRPCALALSGPNRFTYFFGDLDPARHAAEIAELAALYSRSPDGFLARKDRPEATRTGVLGRLPPLGWAGATVETIPLHSTTLKESR